MKIVRHISDWSSFEQEVKTIRTNGKTIVFTNGCFDGLHTGHFALLAFCRDQGDHVIAGLNSDKSVRGIKGEDRPVRPEEERAEALLSSGYVDTVVFYDAPTPRELIIMIKPDVLIKGGDYKKEQIIGAREVESFGGSVKIFPRIPGFSTSEILASENIKKKETK